jgi:L-lactate dehydrogenase (cytochrome)
VQRCVDILRTEIIRTMQLLGVRTLADLQPSHATIR